MIYRVGIIESTQALARELAESGAVHGTAVIAEGQSAGRGTRGRSWLSEPGLNGYLSVILRPQSPLTQAPLLTLGAAAALAECFKLQVKWPNDLVSSEGKKVGGLLGELESRGAQILYVILGLGLNINQQHFPEDLPQASSLALVQGELLDKEAVIEQALFAILEGAEHVDRLNRWRGVSRTLGRQVRVGELEGLAVAIQEDGGLLLETKWGIRVIYSGLVEEQVGQSSSG